MRRKKENKGLPSRWRHYHGAYYYSVPANQKHRWDNKSQFRLGKTLTEAYKVWSDRLELHAEARTIGDLLDRYAIEVVPDKAPKTQQSNMLAIKKLRAPFGKMPINALKPIHVYKYMDMRHAKTAANREVEVLSHAYTMAIKWGLTDRHPIKGKVQKTKTKARDRYIEDWELVEALKVAPKIIQAYITLKLLTGLRRGDLLRLQVAHLKDDGIHVTTGKTGKRVIIEWTHALREAIENIKAIRRKVVSMYLFHTNKGQPYVKEDGTANGWDSLWQRFMRKVIKETAVQERFTEHDLRAKCASDLSSLEHAQALLTHSDSALTKRVYRRKPERVKPSK